MHQKINKPKIIKAHGNIPKQIEEFIGIINTNTQEVSIARMKSPQGWKEPGQTPEFDEYTLVLKGTLIIESQNAKYEVEANQAFIARKGEWIRYSSPYTDGAEYIAICLPAFTPETVHRDG